ncbi:MAG: NUDIX hydrolase [Planctomycetota bacterium]
MTDLRQALGQHVPADDVEAHHRGRMLKLLNTPAPLFRGQFTPGHFTASAFVVHGDSVLLIWHAKLLRWLQPGGHVDETDADLAATAARELHEEAGIVASADRLLDLDVHAIPANPKKNEPAHEHFDVRYLFHVDDPTAVAGDDALDVKWVPIADVSLEQTDESVMRAVRKLR